MKILYQGNVCCEISQLSKKQQAPVKIKVKGRKRNQAKRKYQVNLPRVSCTSNNATNTSISCITILLKSGLTNRPSSSGSSQTGRPLPERKRPGSSSSVKGVPGPTDLQICGTPTVIPGRLNLSLNFINDLHIWEKCEF